MTSSYDNSTVNKQLSDAEIERTISTMVGALIQQMKECNNGEMPESFTKNTGNVRKINMANIKLVPQNTNDAPEQYILSREFDHNNEHIRPGVQAYNYVLAKGINAGKSATIYLGYDYANYRPVAIKIMSYKYSEAAKMEVNILKILAEYAKLKGDNDLGIINIMECFKYCPKEETLKYVDENTQTLKDVVFVWCVTDLYAGDLLRLMQSYNNGRGLPFKTVMQIANKMLRTLSILHSRFLNLVHLDIKPENIVFRGSLTYYDQFTKAADNVNFRNRMEYIKSLDSKFNPDGSPKTQEQIERDLPEADDLFDELIRDFLEKVNDIPDLFYASNSQGRSSSKGRDDNDIDIEYTVDPSVEYYETDSEDDEPVNLDDFNEVDNNEIINDETQTTVNNITDSLGNVQLSPVFETQQQFEVQQQTNDNQDENDPIRKYNEECEILMERSIRRKQSVADIPIFPPQLEAKYPPIDVDSIFSYAGARNLQVTEEVERFQRYLPDIDNIVENIDIALIDFGESVFMNWTSGNSEYVTRQYRAPEHVIDYNQTDRVKFTPATDIFSLGATLFECLTGETLLNVIKPEDFPELGAPNKDAQHLYLIQRHFGKIPQHMIDRSGRKDHLFDSRNPGGLRFIKMNNNWFDKEKHLKEEPPTENGNLLRFRLRTTRPDIPVQYLYDFEMILRRMCDPDPAKRPTAASLRKLLLELFKKWGF